MKPKASILSVFLIYFCSLLPDPDWPYSPLPPNFQTWLWSMLGEVLLMIPCFFGPWLEKKWKVPIVVSSVTLPAARIFILSIMSATFFASRRTYDASSTNEERDPLLRTQQDSQGHGSILSTSRACDAQAVSTFEYLRGFRDLIPYLW